LNRVGPSPNATAKVGRNDPCPCGSGRKYKHCCLPKDASAEFAAGTAREAPRSPALRHRVQALFLAATQHWEAGRATEAISLFQEITRLDPNSAQAHHDLGLACLRSGWLVEATASLRRALELQPGLDRALGYLATALLQQGREREAALAFRKLGRRAEDPVERRFLSARALAMEGKPEEAEKELRRLLAQAPETAPARALLGELLSNRGMFEEASRHLSHAVEAFPPAFQQLTSAKRMTEADRPLAERMRSLAERPGLDALPLISLRFALGKAYDDLGDYQEAMRHYDEANRLRAMSVRFDRPALAAEYDSLIAGFTAEAFQCAREALGRPAGPGDETPVFIVGMPRSGTTLVEQILSSHPAVAAGGELSFWGDRLGGWDTPEIGPVEAGALAKAAHDYRASLRQIGPAARRVTDKRPWNFELLWLIRLALPDARVIHCRRNPVDTCLSIFFANFGARLDYGCGRGDLAFFYRQYERLMNHWRSVLPADRFIEVGYERLIADREAETRRLIAFCGLEWDDACLTPERNGRVVNTASLWQARQPVYDTSVDRWRRYEPWLGELRELMPAPALDD
jgi:tetratricopeptide (TPR) repeat protein